VASNTQLAGVLVAAGFLVVPEDGKWSDSRGTLAFLGIVAMIGMVIFVNVSEFELHVPPPVGLRRVFQSSLLPFFFGPAHDQATDRERARLNPPSAVVEIPVVAHSAEQGMENADEIQAGSSSLSDLEAQLEGRSK